MLTRRSVFMDETKLDISYVPRKLLHRDGEMRLLKEFFSFALTQPWRMAQRVLIVGDVGTGENGFDPTFRS